MTNLRPQSIEEMDLPLMDVLSPEFAADPVRAMRVARESGMGMAKSHRGVELLTYHWVSSLIVDPRFHTVDAAHFQQKGAPESMLCWARDGLLLSMEKERHDKVRLVLSRAFTLRRIDEQRELMQTIAHRWIDTFAATGRCDFVQDFTLRYPMELLCRYVGVPVEDIPVFLGAAQDLHLLAAVPMAPGFDRIDRALNTMEAYVVDILERRRSDPQPDYLSALIEAQRTEGELTQSELVGNVINLLFAGAGTTKHQLASAVQLFVETGVWDDLAREPDLVAPAIEEAMRMHPVTQFVVRIPYEDVVIGDHLFPARRRVILNLKAASRDPKAFPDPDRVDYARAGLTRSRLPFGWGSHYCLGHAFARSSMREAVEAMTRRVTEVVLGDGAAMTPTANMLSGPEHLPLRFRPR